MSAPDSPVAEEAARNERSAIVKWLRQQAADAMSMADDSDPHLRPIFVRTASQMATVADLIEEGAHHGDD